MWNYPLKPYVQDFCFTVEKKHNLSTSGLSNGEETANVSQNMKYTLATGFSCWFIGSVVIYKSINQPGISSLIDPKENVTKIKLVQTNCQKCTRGLFSALD